MNKEIQSVIRRMQTVNSGEPWFGRAVLELLKEVDPKKALIKPNGKEHSLLELLYHMNTWASFTLKRIEKEKKMDLAAFEKLDWRVIDPKKHSWKKAMAEFTATHKKIIAQLTKKDDDFLLEIVEERKYNFRFLLHGMIDHTIYHMGQIAYLHKLLA